MIDVNAWIMFHDECVMRWALTSWEAMSFDQTLKIPILKSGLWGLIESNHALNYQLWLAEDRARRDDLGSQFVYDAKREIDWCNQQRNDRMEQIDQFLFECYVQSEHLDVEIHSETPGMMIDRLSILALKKYHMWIQTTRANVSSEHQARCENKYQVLRLQRDRLAQCLQQLMTHLQEKTKIFYVYHQFKMYNDPTLNPALYQHGLENL